MSNVRWLAISSVLIAGFVGCGASAADVTRDRFGMLADGRAVEAVTLSNSSGVAARIIAYGATLQSLLAPDAAGKKADIVLGYSDLESYVSKPEYFGATVGRVANRIAKGRFILDGKTYSLAHNNGENTLHGGMQGLDKVLWTVVGVSRGPSSSVTLRYVSPDGEEGFPGTLTVTAKYSLNEQNELAIEYRATTDLPTVVNITNHTYWNLAGEGSEGGAMNQLMMIPAERYTPVDATLIPTGELRSVKGTVMDFRVAKPIGRDVRDARDPQIVYGRGYDHNWVISAAPVAQPRLVARVQDPVSGRILEVLSNQPGLQFYSGNFLNGTRTGKSSRLYREGDAFVLEPQAFPDTVNQPALGSVRLAPGAEYRNVILFRLSHAQPPR